MLNYLEIICLKLEMSKFKETYKRREKLKIATKNKF
jgi:hypothetical protein